MGHVQHLKFKICLIGETAVGKTNLINRFVNNIFEDKYSMTIGTKISKKEIKVYKSKNTIPINSRLYIWDTMGKQNFQELFNESYFNGVNGIIAVCDVTRKDTLLELNKWMEVAQHHAGRAVPTIFLGNKSDLVDKQQLDLDDIGKFASYYDDTEAFLTSAKTGENVKLAYKTLYKFILKKTP